MGNIGLLICHSIDLQTLCAEIEHFTTLTKKSLKFTIKQQIYNYTSKGNFPKSSSFIHPTSYEEFWSQDLVTGGLTVLLTDRGNNIIVSLVARQQTD